MESIDRPSLYQDLDELVNSVSVPEEGMAPTPMDMDMDLGTGEAPWMTATPMVTPKEEVDDPDTMFDQMQSILAEEQGRAESGTNLLLRMPRFKPYRYYIGLSLA